MTTSTSGFHKSNRFRLALAVGCLIALWNFVLMFRGWVVASQAELVGANILFLFLGLVPWIGLIASGRGNPVGPWILTISPLLALTGLFFTRNAEWKTPLFAMLITAAPAIAIVLVLLTLSRQYSVKTIR
jgi:hypothetical protein